MQGDEKEAAADDDLPPVKYEGEYIKAIMELGEGKASGTGRLKIPRDAPQLIVIPNPTPTPNPNPNPNPNPSPSPNPNLNPDPSPSPIALT